jgi:hypothetical protein
MVAMMPSNTTLGDFIPLLNRLGCVHKATKAERELYHYRKHGSLPEDAIYIAGIRMVDGNEEIELKKGA